MEHFIDGAIMMAYFVVTLFFLPFFRRSRDRLFLFFGIAFLILGLSRLAFAAFNADHEAENVPFYIVRLIAYLLILWAIVDKNRIRAPR